VAVTKVSFGTVIAVSGNPYKIKKINDILMPHTSNGRLMMKDVTKKYANSPADGLMAMAAQNGDRVELYITGDDVEKVHKKKKPWDTIDGILSNLKTKNSYLNVNGLSVVEAAKRILES
jgi:hypothetical protein